MRLCKKFVNFFIISKQDFTVDDENEMLEDLAALMGDDVGGEGEWRSPYYRDALKGGPQVR